MGHEPSRAAEEPPIQAHPERRPAGDIRRLLLDVSRATVSHRDLPSLLALSDTNWVLSGPHGAAARLGLKRTTLQSRMRKLGIERAKA